jgi:hypothetical protein
MRAPFVVIAPGHVYMEIICSSIRFGSCLIRWSDELNDRKPTARELQCAHRYITQEGWCDYANGSWSPDPRDFEFLFRLSYEKQL